MPRKKRIEVPGSLHHIMTRGIDGINLFKDDNDRLFFLETLGKNLLKVSCRCYAWALMNNHYHLLLRPSDYSLGICMRRLNSAYARYFNKKYKRRGFLFQDRYKSIATQDTTYFKELIRYIHLNPIRAGRVKSLKVLGNHKWTSHYDVIHTNRFRWFYKQETLKRFDRNKSEACQKYIAYLSEYSNDKSVSMSSFLINGTEGHGVVDQRVMGDREFIKSALKIDQDFRLKRKMLREEGLTVETIVDKVCHYFDKDTDVLLRPGRNRQHLKIRDAILNYCFTELGDSLSSLGNIFRISPSTVSYGVARGKNALKELKLDSIIELRPKNGPKKTVPKTCNSFFISEFLPVRHSYAVERQNI